MRKLIAALVVFVAMSVGIIATGTATTSAAPVPCVAKASLSSSVAGYINGYERVTASVRTTDYACKQAHPGPMVLTITPRPGTTFLAYDGNVPANWACVLPAVGVEAPVVCTRVTNTPEGTTANFAVKFSMTGYPGPQRPAPQAVACLDTPITDVCVEAYRQAGT